MSALPYTVHAFPHADLTRIRAAGVDDFGNVLAPFDAGGGEQVRCCLREAVLGESIVLISWRPATAGGPYREVGPVFVHAGECAGPPSEPGLPAGLRPRRLLLRAYDRDGRIADAVVVDDGGADAALTTLLARPDVDVVHARNPLWGCYLYSVRRGRPAEDTRRERRQGTTR